jgi:hypothetical protein
MDLNPKLPEFKGHLTDKIKRFVENVLVNQTLMKVTDSEGTEFLSGIELLYIANNSGIVVKRRRGETNVRFKVADRRAVTLARLTQASDVSPEEQAFREHTFGYLPLNAILPKKIRPYCVCTEILRKDTADVFIHAPGNILYNKQCYAANCKHRVSMYDEHPWCIICLMLEGVNPLCKKDCYICAVMSKTARAAREALRTKYIAEINKFGEIQTKPISLRKDILHQIHADIAEENKLGTLSIPNEWSEDYRGFYRCATRVPYFMSVARAAKGVSEEEDLADILKEHFKEMRKVFDSWQENVREEYARRRKATGYYAAKLGLKPSARPQLAKRSKGKPGAAVKRKSSENDIDPTKDDSKSKETRQNEKSDEEQAKSDQDVTATPRKSMRDHRRVPQMVRKVSHRYGAWRYKAEKLTPFTAQEDRNVNFYYSEAAFAAKRIYPKSQSL